MPGFAPREFEPPTWIEVTLGSGRRARVSFAAIEMYREFPGTDDTQALIKLTDEPLYVRETYEELKRMIEG